MAKKKHLGCRVGRGNLAPGQRRRTRLPRRTLGQKGSDPAQHGSVGGSRTVTGQSHLGETLDGAGVEDHLSFEGEVPPPSPTATIGATDEESGNRPGCRRPRRVPWPWRGRRTRPANRDRLLRRKAWMQAAWDEGYSGHVSLSARVGARRVRFTIESALRAPVAPMHAFIARGCVAARHRNPS